MRPYSTADVPRLSWDNRLKNLTLRMAASIIPQGALKSHANVKDRLSLSDGTPALLSPMWVAAVALVNKQGAVLVQQRDIAGSHAGLWEFPGGKLEPGEGPEYAAVRELREELGIIIANDDLRPVSFASGAIERASGAQPLVILLFACERWEGVPVAHAATALEWSDPAALTSWAMPPLDYPLARALVKMLSPDAN